MENVNGIININVTQKLIVIKIFVFPLKKVMIYVKVAPKILNGIAE